MLVFLESECVPAARARDRALVIKPIESFVEFVTTSRTLKVKVGFA